ncbi:YolD-like family protein [Fodinisporobacter ferrooxydans]|uniref:YolD-like family protein n=1 Tax=Fodinisporobacter ferrooxydans TaxID=2901836 RepID=A0ABY4CIH0_9BACL|nr:YolD-like family protein [Alicyclobacillaceae bacterium MYW30-H2]
MRMIDGNIFEEMRMTIPEHRKAMVRMNQAAKRMEKPQLAQDCLEEMSLTLAAAIQDCTVVTIKRYHALGSVEIELVPHKIDPYLRVLKGVTSTDESISIPLTEILDVQV